MAGKIGVRRETKSTWERRTALTPDLARKLVAQNGIEICIQPSSRRVFPDNDYVRTGANLIENLSDVPFVLGVKEIPPELLEENTAYAFFSHVIKGQPYNMAMLQKILDLGCTLIDYERIADDSGRRLIFFGRFAGLAGMIDSLWTLGRRLQVERIRTPLADLQPAHAYESLHEAKLAVRKAGERIASEGLPSELTPLTVGIAGYGNVAAGVREILAELPTREVAPENLTDLTADPSPHCIYQTTFREEHLVEPTDANRSFVLQDYYDHPEGYRSVFGRYLPQLTLLMNCNYWDERYPRLVTKDQLRDLFAPGGPHRPKVIGDLGCDIEGAVECTLKCTEPADPTFVFDPTTGAIESGVDGDGPVILAVDILPAELPREASEEFSEALARFLPALAQADYSVEFSDLDLPPEILRAVITHRGQLTPDYAYLEEHLEKNSEKS